MPTADAEREGRPDEDPRAGDGDRGERGEPTVHPEAISVLARRPGRRPPRGARRIFLEAGGAERAVAAGVAARAPPVQATPGRSAIVAPRCWRRHARVLALLRRLLDLHVERRGRGLAPLQELGGEQPLHVARRPAAG